MENQNCPVCLKTCCPGRGWHTNCPSCGHRFGAPNQGLRPEDTLKLTEGAPIHFLDDLRQRNFRRILGRLSGLCPGRDILDVGCAHGVFLRMCLKGGWQGRGIEPDEKMASRGLREGLPILSGYFPSPGFSEDEFDGVVFNDSFEHISDVNLVLDSCRRILKRNGVLVLNLPLQEGIFFRLAELFSRVGVTGPWERLWQKGLPSPHVHYFSRKSLNALLSRKGFSLVDSLPLETYSRKGLFQRLCFDRKRPVVVNSLMYLILSFVHPVFRQLPPDIGVFFFRRS